MILLFHALATLLMCGVIWYVQVVHYPLFDRVGTRGFGEYEKAHAQRTTWVVAPLMLLELGTALALVASSSVATWQSLTGLVVLGSIWAATAFWQVPYHRALEIGFDKHIHRALVRSNWFRTGAWSLRAVLVLTMLASAQAT